MPPRTRTRGGVGSTGVLTHHLIPGDWVVSSTYNAPSGFTERCDDVTGNPFADNALTIDKTVVQCQPLVPGGSSSNGSYYATSGSVVPNVASSIVSNIPLPSTSALVDKLMANTNPNRADIDLPVFLFELKDIPKMVKEAGDAIRWYRGISGASPPTVKGLANANLAYQFGWAPLFSDIYKLFSLLSGIEKRREEINNLFSKGGLRRNVSLGQQSSSNSQVVSIASSPIGTDISATRTTTHSLKSWGSVRWVPTATPGQTPQKPSDWDLFRQIYGLDVGPATLWEAIPWSWLIDYFASVGDFLNARRNSIPVKATRICIMHTRTTSITFSDIKMNSSSPLSWGGATGTRTEKFRTPTVPSALPTAKLRYLGAQQLSILGSLLITRI